MHAVACSHEVTIPVCHVIQTAGPVWEGGSHGEGAILASCYRRSRQEADELQARGVAFPAIATGVYGFPPDQAAKIAVETIRSIPSAAEHVLLIASDQPARDLHEATPAAGHRCGTDRGTRVPRR